MIDHLRSGGVPYKYISNSTVGSLERDVLSVLTMLWLSASSTRRSSAVMPSVTLKDDRPSGEGPRVYWGCSPGASSSVLSTNPSQMSTSPSLELERLL